MGNYLLRLANHANRNTTEPPEESLVWNLWNADYTHRFPNIKKLCDDLMSCLDEANHAINGEHPSRNVGPNVRRNESILHALISDICIIAQACNEYALLWERKELFTDAERNLLRQYAWVIMQGWLYILDGDIDSITEEAMLSGEVREIL